MIVVILSAAAGIGAYYLYTAIALGWQGYELAPRLDDADRMPRRNVDSWLREAGIDNRLAEVLGVMLLLFLVGAAAALAVFGGPLPALVAGAFAASSPAATLRVRRQSRRAKARDAWPRLLEQVRLLTGALGRSIPQALFEAGAHAPEELRPAFTAAQREWLLTTDLTRALAVLKERLADPTADIVAETLLVAHEVGGSEVDTRLQALIEDRVLDLQSRKDARARQAGARFARRFVLLVPLGMAVAGLGIGDGRAAYQTPVGQVLVAVGIGLVAVCWIWAGRIMVLPEDERVLVT